MIECAIYIYLVLMLKSKIVTIVLTIVRAPGLSDSGTDIVLFDTVDSRRIQ
jgi:hypothetical protein